MGRARRTERGERGRQKESQEAGEREREEGQKGRGGRRKQKQQQLEKPESGKKWGVVNRALAGSPTAPPPSALPPCPPGLSLHLTATPIAEHHEAGQGSRKPSGGWGGGEQSGSCALGRDVLKLGVRGRYAGPTRGLEVRGGSPRIPREPAPGQTQLPAPGVWNGQCLATGI